MLVLFVKRSVWAEMVGDFNIRFPVSLEKWISVDNPYLETYQGKTYIHKNGYFTEIFTTLSNPNLRHAGSGWNYLQIPAIEDYVKELAQKNCPEGHTLSVSDILVLPRSLFYKTTIFFDGRVVAIGWHRDYLHKSGQIAISYIVRDKRSGSPASAIKEMDEIAKIWVRFMRDDFIGQMTN